MAVTRKQGLGASLIAALRDTGWTDEEVLAATHIIGFFNYYARMADALGVEPEEFMESRRAEWAEWEREGRPP